MIAFAYGKSSKPVILLGLACIVLLLHWCTPAIQMRIGVGVSIGLLGAWLALLQRERWLKRLLLGMFMLNLAALGLNSDGMLPSMLLTLLHLFVMA